jgi:predicted oxidoreductase
METFAASLTAAQRRKLDAAVDSLMDRDDIAEAFAHLKEVGPA